MAALMFTAQGLPLGQAAQSISDLLKVHQDQSRHRRQSVARKGGKGGFFLPHRRTPWRQRDASTGGLVVARRRVSLPRDGDESVGREPTQDASRARQRHRGTATTFAHPRAGAGNPENRALQSMVELTKDGYKRPLAPKLSELAASMGEIKDTAPGGISLREQVIRTLDVEVERANRQGNDRLAASVARDGDEAVFSQPLPGCQEVCPK